MTTTNITKTLTVTLKTANDGDLNTVTGIQDMDREPIEFAFDDVTAVATLVDSEDGEVEEQISALLDADDNVRTYEFVSDPCEIRVTSTAQLNLDPSMFGDASQVAILAQWDHGARISVPSVELAFVEAALDADERVTSYEIR